MKAAGPSTRPLSAAAAFAVLLLGLSACGPRVESGNEDFVLVKAGPLTSFSDSQSFAQEYCAQFDKRASVQGSDPDPDTLQDTYRFDCVQGLQ